MENFMYYPLNYGWLPPLTSTKIKEVVNTLHYTFDTEEYPIIEDIIGIIVQEIVSGKKIKNNIENRVLLTNQVKEVINYLIARTMFLSKYTQVHKYSISDDDIQMLIGDFEIDCNKTDPTNIVIKIYKDKYPSYLEYYIKNQINT